MNHPRGTKLLVLLGANLNQLLNTHRIKLVTLSLQTGFGDEFLSDKPIATFPDQYKIGFYRLALDIVQLLLAFFVEALIDKFNSNRFA